MDHKPIVFLFSGQGSQYYQMGRGLYTTEARFRRCMDDFDQIAQELLGVSIVRLLYAEDKRIYDDFSQTIYTNPAIFMVESALALTLIEDGIQPDYLIGTSLGEFAAAALAGVITHERALTLVIKQGQCLEQACEAGQVLAVFAKADLYAGSTILQAHSELVAVHGESHFVIAESEKRLATVKRYLKEAGIMYQPLPVAHGFHSANIDPAYPCFAATLAQETVQRPQLPMLSSRFGQAIATLTPDYFWEVIRKPILFGPALTTLAPSTQAYHFIDLGPTGTLANFVKHALAAPMQNQGRDLAQLASIWPIMSQYRTEVDNLQQIRTQAPFLRKKASPVVHSQAKTGIAYLFPGQGSQKKGMGAELFTAYPELVAQADAILGYSSAELCLVDPEKKLDKTQYTQPALYVVNALSYLQQSAGGRAKPDYVAGHSLGEYNALFAAGAFDFATGVRLVKKRGELMASAQEGGMAAIIGLTEAQIVDLLQASTFSDIEIANLNAPLQTVIAGPKQAILQARTLFEGAGCELYLPLPVSGAFHSQLMAAARTAFGAYLQQFTFAPLQRPVIANVLARPYTDGTIKQLLTDQITHSVRWTASMRYLLAHGVTEFCEIGPGAVLTKLIAKIKAE